jgi:glycosyltransferase involved in cell wall biosynthesis
MPVDQPPLEVAGVSVGAPADTQAAAGPAAGAALAEHSRRVAVVGVSTDATCGVRDHATLLAAALAQEHVSCSLHWLTREERALAPARAELVAWTERLAIELAVTRPDAVLLHYSVFTYSYKGVPLLLRPVLKVVRELGAPLVTVLHEYAYPWGRSGARGATWALTQRAMLIELMRASAAVVVTADFRAEQLASRRWLPRRPVAVAPVFSNLPHARANPPAPQGELPTLGLFGYASEGAEVELVLDALAALARGGRRIVLRLLGAPGADSPSGQAWLAGAAARGLDPAPSFSGKLAAQDLADALADCELLLFVDSTGPTSRKTTLAASLDSATAVVAIDGPQSWRELIDADAAQIVAPDAVAFGRALAELLDDPQRREELGARGRAFARREMAVGPSAAVVADLLERAISGSRG